MPTERRAAASKATVAATKPDAQASQLPNALVFTLDDFEETNSNLLYDAWRFRGSEYHLYPLYSQIFTLSCWNLRHPNQPRATLVSCPQPLFGDPPPAKMGHEVKNKSNPKAKGNVKAKGSPKTAQGDSGTELKSSVKQIPDFARILVFSDDGERLQGTGLSSIHELVEFCELKVLNCNYSWWRPQAQSLAEAEISQHLLQVYDAAMAGFAHNPKWKQVHAVLIIGAFFTQIVWSTRPSDEVLQPLPPPRVPKKIKSGRPYGKVIDALLSQIPGFEIRVTPQCLFHNAHVFQYHPNSEDPNYPRVSLSKEFLHALDRPISKLYPQLTSRSTLFAPPASKPRILNGTNSKFGDEFKRVLIELPTARAKEQASALGYRFPEDEAKAATPTPPNSVAEERFKRSVKNVKLLPKPHIVTRKKSAMNVPAMDNSGDEDSDSDSEDEGDSDT